MKLLNGSIVAKKIYAEIKKEVAKIKKKPTLAVILVGNDPASKLYVSIKEKRCQEVGIGIKIFNFPANSADKQFSKSNFQNKIIGLIKKLNADKKITGMIVQLPLPKHLNTNKIIETIDPNKDVDGLHPENIGKLLIGDKTLLPPTAAGIMEIFRNYKIKLTGKHVVMVGYGKLVGKPLAAMISLSNELATLTVCNHKTKNLANYTKQADILISATGVGHLIKADMIKKGVIIVDAGTTKIGGKIVGDVDFENVSKIASYITPPKGGVGPMTVAMLLKNLVNINK